MDADGEDALRVVRGEPTDEELAALVAVVAALAAAHRTRSRAAPEYQGAWRDRARSVPPRLTGPAADAWRHSALPV